MDVYSYTSEAEPGIKARRRWPLWGELPAQRDSNTENVSIWWRHHFDADALAQCATGKHGLAM